MRACISVCVSLKANGMKIPEPINHHGQIVSQVDALVVYPKVWLMPLVMFDLYFFVIEHSGIVYFRMNIQSLEFLKLDALECVNALLVFTSMLSKTRESAQIDGRGLQGTLFARVHSRKEHTTKNRISLDGFVLPSEKLAKYNAAILNGENMSSDA